MLNSKMASYFHRFSSKSHSFGENTVRNLISMANLGFHEFNNTSELRYIDALLSKKKHDQTSRWRPKWPPMDPYIFNVTTDFWT